MMCNSFLQVHLYLSRRPQDLGRYLGTRCTACGAGAQQSALKGGLCILAVVLLVSRMAGGPVNVSKGSKALAKPDRCNGLWGSWVCWGFTWGAVREENAKS